MKLEKNTIAKALANVPQKWYTWVMNSEECTIYQGDCFTLVWYYDKVGKSQAYDFFLGLDDDRKRKFLILVKRMGDAGKIFDTTKFRNEGDQIFAFKPQPDRFLCFFYTGKKIVVTNGFTKKSQKIPPGEKERSLECKKDFEERQKSKKEGDGNGS